LPFTHEEILETVPVHLQRYVIQQEYDRYSPRDHAVWRYIMRRNLRFLKKHAHPAYEGGLGKTGITTERIPDMRDMNRALSEIGWRAVVVNGFLPPAAFMEFQAHRILVVSAEMRTIDHILYTPAPDIVHEAAGHAPFIAHETYSTYLQKFGVYGAKAISSKRDFDIYEAIRALSIIKEYPHATEADIRAAEDDLQQKLSANKKPSEATLLSRLHWWTVEYGLIGTPNNFKQFGAGLLSSLGESQGCLSPKVKKLDLNAECIRYDYDITSMQPQLFVTRNWEHLLDVLESFADTMAFRRADRESITRAVEAETVATIELSSGIQISGIIDQVSADGSGKIRYIRTKGPTALACGYHELSGHGTDTHRDGLGFPIGVLRGLKKPLEHLNDGDLREIGIVRGHDCSIDFETGIRLQGKLTTIGRSGENLVLLGFVNATVSDRDGKLLFQPDWGQYDLAVGKTITSVFQGSADRERFNVLPPQSAHNAIPVRYSAKELNLFDLYEEIRRCRESGRLTGTELSDIIGQLDRLYPEEWLLRLEVAELMYPGSSAPGQRQKLFADLEKLKGKSETYKTVISEGLENLVTGKASTQN
jgi:phenylalanine-4-hydroxylase